MSRRAVLVVVAAAAVVWAVGSSGSGHDDAPPAAIVAPTPDVTTPVSEATPTPSPTRAPPTPVARPRAGTALAAVATLAVKGRAPRTGYSREAFGQSWRDLDRNGCDQRNDVLRRDLRKIVLKEGTHGCVVLRGRFVSPFTGETIDFRRGVGTSNRVQIDHVVALSDAWQKGAQTWTAEKRERFANDLLELVAADAHSNASKGDGDAATWLPPRRAWRCAYVARQVAVKQRYGLWVTSAERDAMRRVLSRCPDEPLPRAAAVPLGGFPEAADRPRAARRVSGGGATSFVNCDAVRAAGKAPIRRGDPGYARHLDRDGDGIGCE
jgi:hypothetical protein